MSKHIGKFHTWMMIFTLLLLNIVEQAGSITNSTIPGMAKSFPNVALVNIESTTTIVSIVVTVFVLVSGIVVNKIGQKNTAVIGLIIASISSIIPAMIKNFAVIIVSRAIFGIGIGLVNPLAISLIGVFFTGEQRTRLMGWRSAIAGLGTSIMTLVAGALISSFNWQAAYWAYLLFIPTLVLFIIFVPDPVKSGAIKRQKAEQEENTNVKKDEHSNESVNPLTIVVLLAVLTLLITAMGMIFSVKLPTFFVDSKVGSAAQSSIVLSVAGVGSVFGGFIFEPCYKVFKRNILPISLALGGIGMSVMAMMRNITLISITAFITGFATSLVVPYIYNRITEISTPEKSPLFTSLALVGSNVGVFLSPYAGELLGNHAYESILNAGIVLVILAVISWGGIILLQRKSNHSHLLN